jgi:hypothetical protein
MRRNDNGNGEIAASSLSSGGGNINLQSPDLILRNQSAIATNARGSNNIGGDITIDTDNLVAWHS